MRARWALAAVLSTAFLSREALAESAKKPPLHVLAFDWDGDCEPQAESLFRALGVRVRENPNYSLGERQQPASSLAVVAGCKDGAIVPSCEDGLLKLLKSDRFLWGTVKRDKGAAVVTAELHLVQKGFPQVTVRETYNVRLADTYDPILQELAEKMLHNLLEGSGAFGSLRIRTGAVECPLSIDGAPKGETSRGILSVQLHPGIHAVETLPPCEPLVTRLFVPAGGVTEVNFGKDAQPEDDAPLAWRKPLGIGLLAGGAVLGIGLGGAFFGARYFSNRADAEESWKREAFDTPALDCDNALDNAKATASCGSVRKAERAGNLALVTAGAGLAIMGVGAYFFFTAPKANVARTRLSPWASQGGAGAALSGQF